MSSRRYLPSSPFSLTHPRLENFSEDELEDTRPLKKPIFNPLGTPNKNMESSIEKNKISTISQENDSPTKNSRIKVSISPKRDQNSHPKTRNYTSAKHSSPTKSPSCPHKNPKIPITISKVHLELPPMALQKNQTSGSSVVSKKTFKSVPRQSTSRSAQRNGASAVARVVSQGFKDHPQKGGLKGNLEISGPPDAKSVHPEMYSKSGRKIIDYDWKYGMKHIPVWTTNQLMKDKYAHKEDLDERFMTKQIDINQYHTEIQDQIIHIEPTGLEAECIRNTENIIQPERDFRVSIESEIVISASNKDEVKQNTDLNDNCEEFSKNHEPAVIQDSDPSRIKPGEIFNQEKHISESLFNQIQPDCKENLIKVEHVQSITDKKGPRDTSSTKSYKAPINAKTNVKEIINNYRSMNTQYNGDLNSKLKSQQFSLDEMSKEENQLGSSGAKRSRQPERKNSPTNQTHTTESIFTNIKGRIEIVPQRRRKRYPKSSEIGSKKRLFKRSLNKITYRRPSNIEQRRSLKNVEAGGFVAQPQSYHRSPAHNPSPMLTKPFMPSNGNNTEIVSLSNNFLITDSDFMKEKYHPEIYKQLMTQTQALNKMNHIPISQNMTRVHHSSISSQPKIETLGISKPKVFISDHERPISTEKNQKICKINLPNGTKIRFAHHRIKNPQTKIRYKFKCLLEQIIEERPNITLFMTPDLKKIGEYETQMEKIRRKQKNHQKGQSVKAMRDMTMGPKPILIQRKDNRNERTKSKFSRCNSELSAELNPAPKYPADKNPLYSIVLNRYGKEIKSIEEISFREFYVILVQASTFNIQCNQSTPLKEIQVPADSVSELLDVKVLEDQRVLSDSVSGEQAIVKTISSNKGSESKIEYKALLPQYKEFYSESEFNRTKDSNVDVSLKIKEVTESEEPKKEEKLQNEVKHEILKIKELPFQSQTAQRIIVNRKRRVRTQNKARANRNTLYTRYNKDLSFKCSPMSPSKISETRRLLNSTKRRDIGKAGQQAGLSCLLPSTVKKRSLILCGIHPGKDAVNFKNKIKDFSKAFK
ncbi:unnamed protein product [Moneuplotes crassus]|uniref:Uncharacterized protein n=1 Tax=Euplotes crassus TaxID=5936 RepID=A0AAD1UI13_EUPCR|nr:unnamed protein product [Moneuplotes crassus]